MKKKFIKILLLILIGLNLILSSWYVLHGDIHFPSDIARDFLLMREIDQKKIILIGPRSSISGFFHGPLWAYINYPAYIIGRGNPVIVGWFWIFLIICFLYSSYFIAKEIFSRTTGYIYVLMLSWYLIYHANRMFNPHGAMLLVPLFIYLIIKYLQTLKIKYLILHILTACAMIQFQIAIGMPFLIMSFLLLVWYSMVKHKIKHLFSFF